MSGEKGREKMEARATG